MILDRGYCTIYTKINTATAGNMPAVSLGEIKHQSWYGELSFETTQANIGKQQETEISTRIRILQNRSVGTHDIAVLSSALPPPVGSVQFDILRAYHGVDDESGELITDLSLREVQQQYDASRIP
jgi:hypothetical protein